MGARYVTFDELGPVLDWLTGQRPDSAHAHFGMFHVSIGRPETLGGIFGASDAMRRLNQFGNVLAATVRRTDVVARDLADFWILTPECDADMVGCRLCEIVAGLESFGLDMEDCSIGAYLFPLKDVEFAGAGARVVVDRLKNVTPQFRFLPASDCKEFSMLRGSDKRDPMQDRVQKNCYRARPGSAPPGS